MLATTHEDLDSMLGLNKEIPGSLARPTRAVSI
jgi:hypothetical protein